MSMLIVGGLFGIALLAIIGVVLTVISERQAMERAQAAKPAPAQAATKQDATPAAFNAVSVAVAPEPVMENTEPTLNEQIYELSAQLDALHQQAQNLESRLSMLIALAERFESPRAIPVYNLMDEKLPLTPIPVE